MTNVWRRILLETPQHTISITRNPVRIRRRTLVDTNRTTAAEVVVVITIAITRDIVDGILETEVEAAEEDVEDSRVEEIVVETMRIESNNNTENGLSSTSNPRSIGDGVDDDDDDILTIINNFLCAPPIDLVFFPSPGSRFLLNSAPFFPHLKL